MVSGESVCGSLKTCRVAMIEKTPVRTRAGAIIGILIRSAIWTCDAPSIRAASYSSDGTARSAVYMTIMLNPVPPHTPMLATEKQRHVRGEQVGHRQPEPGQDRRERRHRGQVEEAPQQRGDHRRHRVRQEDRQPGEPLEPHPPRVEQQREQQGEAEHHRHQDQAVDEHRARREDEERRVGQRAGVVGQARRTPAAGAPAPRPSPLTCDLLHRQVHRVADRDEQQQREQRHGRGHEGVRRHARRRTLLRCCFTSAGRNREAALLHVAHHGRLHLGERGEERPLAR